MILDFLELQVAPILPIKVSSQLAFLFRRSSKLTVAAILDRKKLAIFDLQVTQILPTKFQVNWPLGSEEEVQNRFPR